MSLITVIYGTIIPILLIGTIFIIVGNRVSKAA